MLLIAIKSAVAAVEVNVVERHIRHCLKNAFGTKERAESNEIISEIIDLLRSSVK